MEGEQCIVCEFTVLKVKNGFFSLDENTQTRSNIRISYIFQKCFSVARHSKDSPSVVGYEKLEAYLSKFYKKRTKVSGFRNFYWGIVTWGKSSSSGLYCMFGWDEHKSSLLLLTTNDCPE